MRHFILLSALLSLLSCQKDSVDDTTTNTVLVLNANPADDTSPYQTMSGISADGYSQIEFAIPYNSSNLVVDVKITEPAEAWGTLESTLSYPTEKNQLRAYRFTLTSEESLPDELINSYQAKRTYYFEITTSDGASKRVARTISVVRPPALFVHGLASSAETFDTMLGYIIPKGLYLNQALLAADYSQSATDSYQTNKDVVPNAISELRSAMAGAGIVCDKVSVLGHSMGGILTRIYMQGGSSVAYRDDMLKFVTINTPHSGSQLADFAVAYGSANPNGVIESIASLGAIVDLAVGSDATTSLNSQPNLNAENNLDIPTHLITSVIGTVSGVMDLVENDQTIAALVSFALNKIESELLYNETSDIVVPTTSQKGGVNNPISKSYIKEFSNEWHCSVLTSEEVAEHVVDILEATTTSNYFTTDGFNPAQLSFSTTY